MKLNVNNSLTLRNNFYFKEFVSILEQDLKIILVLPTLYAVIVKAGLFILALE